MIRLWMELELYRHAGRKNPRETPQENAPKIVMGGARGFHERELLP